MRQFKSLFLLLAFVMMAGACTYANTEPNQFACAYGGGPFEAKSQKGDDPIMPSSGRQRIGVSDTVIYLDADVRNYIIDRSVGVGDVATVDFVSSTTLDGVEMEYEMSIKFRYNLNNGCEFWEEHGQRYAVNTDEGWALFLADNMRPIIESSMKAQSQTEGWKNIWKNRPVGDEPVWTTFQNDLGQTLVTRLNRSLGGEFFCGVSWKPGDEECAPFEVLIKSAEPEKESLTNIEADIQAEAAKTDVEKEIKSRELDLVELQAEIDLSEAQAQIEVSKVLAEKAEIDAQASAAECAQLASIGVDCTLLEAAQNGSIDFWIRDGDGVGSLPVPTFPVGE